MRYKGRLITDDTVLGFTSGFITLLCLPTTNQVIPTISDDATADDANEFVIATEPFMVINDSAGGDNNAEFGSVYDWDMQIKTSRTCSRGGRIIAQVHNDATSTNGIVINCLLSLFRTIA